MRACGAARRSSTTSRPSPTSPPIIRNGGEWFAGIGTEKSKGTKVFALAGKISNTGLIEVPMGITLREIVYDIGGGIPDGKQLQGGADRRALAAAAFPSSSWTSPVDYESLAKVGSIMGSGGMIVMDETSCMVDVARYFMEFCMDESCGKCIPCRVGHGADARAAREDHAQARPRRATWRCSKSCATWCKNTSLCGLGQTAPNPVLSTLRYFREEYEEHIGGAGCAAGRLPVPAEEVTRRRRRSGSRPSASTAARWARAKTRPSWMWRGKTDLHSHVALSARAFQRGRLPPVSRGGERSGAPAAGLRHARERRHGGHGALRAAGPLPARHSGAAVC